MSSRETVIFVLPLKTFIKITFKAMLVETLPKILKRDEGSTHTKKIQRTWKKKRISIK